MVVVINSNKLADYHLEPSCSNGGLIFLCGNVFLEFLCLRSGVIDVTFNILVDLADFFGQFLASLVHVFNLGLFSPLDQSVKQERSVVAPPALQYILGRALLCLLELKPFLPALESPRNANVVVPGKSVPNDPVRLLFVLILQLVAGLSLLLLLNLKLLAGLHQLVECLGLLVGLLDEQLFRLEASLGRPCVEGTTLHPELNLSNQDALVGFGICKGVFVCVHSIPDFAH